jgi:hypothetical protein
MITIGDCEVCGSRCRAGSKKCASCEADERKNERFAKKQKVVRSVQKVTLKRAKQNHEFQQKKFDYLALYPMCEEEGCEQKSVDVHHQAGKENGRLLDENYFIALCRPHHTYYTEHSAEAIRKGISVLRTQKEETKMKRYGDPD